MCRSIIIDGDVFDTIGDLDKRLCGNVVMDHGFTIKGSEPETCCCLVDVQATAVANGYTAETDGVDWRFIRARGDE